MNPKNLFTIIKEFISKFFKITNLKSFVAYSWRRIRAKQLKMTLTHEQKELQQRLYEYENFFGGLVTSVVRRQVSKWDPRSPESISTGGCTGGDRFSESTQNYGYAYAKYCFPLFKNATFPYRIAEIGILRGSGIATWSALFPNSMVCGLDIDISHTRENLAHLKIKGAFKFHDPVLSIFDQYQPDTSLIKRLAGNQGFDLVVDDGCHDDVAIYRTIKVFQDYMVSKPSTVYIIEDNFRVHSHIKKILKIDVDVFSHGPLTIVSGWNKK